MQPAKGTEAANLLKMCLQMPICLREPHGYRAAEERSVWLAFSRGLSKKIVMAVAWPLQHALSLHFCYCPKPLRAKLSHPNCFIFRPS